MKLFECQHCGQLLYFENTLCENCGHLLGYLPEQAELSAVEATGDGDTWHALASPGSLFRFCANSNHDACNWLVADNSGDAFCRACRLNRTIPDLDADNNLLLWQRMEEGKHRLIYSLLRLGLPVVSKHDDRRGLAFDILSDAGTAFQEGPQVMTGHAEGLITINLAEADDVERERHRRDMAETYRTILGHFRHESGHHYWERLVKDGVWHAAYREQFGDERRDYGDTLKQHYSNGPPADWRDRYVSSYASAHPWEDFAETWAHYLHIVDTLETAAVFGLRIQAKAGRTAPLAMAMDFDPYRSEDFDALMAAWHPLTQAVNSLNHSMGQPDLYPFVLAPAVVGKLRFVHGLIHRPEAPAGGS